MIDSPFHPWMLGSYQEADFLLPALGKVIEQRGGPDAKSMAVYDDVWTAMRCITITTQCGE